MKQDGKRGKKNDEGRDNEIIRKKNQEKPIIPEAEATRMTMVRTVMNAIEEDRKDGGKRGMRKEEGTISSKTR